MDNNTKNDEIQLNFCVSISLKTMMTRDKILNFVVDHDNNQLSVVYMSPAYSQLNLNIFISFVIYKKHGFMVESI